jgi:hypothetical protein
MFSKSFCTVTGWLSWDLYDITLFFSFLFFVDLPVARMFGAF